ncbi:hypothetical protein BGZ61DRAFT_487240 [Ilyonectria robusta]|uniref:uncharacterized protein n=1 Tax=Ilyonectria robusta TaxID=1079257 RepID=UPI001E8DA14E|nr:uncharacterized protein BGZ61DRAFT_487240 [Ilyonectria robusta]KAH8653910.1 hypothetical protein BGZ61DRAFT_487240 [Ilyonectria robusta]
MEGSWQLRFFLVFGKQKTRMPPTKHWTQERGGEKVKSDEQRLKEGPFSDSLPTPWKAGSFVKGPLKIMWEERQVREEKYKISFDTSLHLINGIKYRMFSKGWDLKYTTVSNSDDLIVKYDHPKRGVAARRVKGHVPRYQLASMAQPSRPPLHQPSNSRNCVESRRRKCGTLPRELYDVGLIRPYTRHILRRSPSQDAPVRVRGRSNVMEVDSHPWLAERLKEDATAEAQINDPMTNSCRAGLAGQQHGETDGSGQRRRGHAKRGVVGIMGVKNIPAGSAGSGSVIYVDADLRPGM